MVLDQRIPGIPVTPSILTPALLFCDFFIFPQKKTPLTPQKNTVDHVERHDIETINEKHVFRSHVVRVNYLKKKGKTENDSLRV